MVTFSVPAYGTVETTLELQDPQLFDSHSYTKPINVHVSRNRTIRTVDAVSDVTKRVITKELTFEFNLAKMKEFKAFFETAKGEYVKYTDYDGTEWICLVDLDLIDYTSTGSAKSACDPRDEYFQVTLIISAWIDGQGTTENPDEIPPA